MVVVVVVVVVFDDSQVCHAPASRVQGFEMPQEPMVTNQNELEGYHPCSIRIAYDQWSRTI
jgi:hypothetical protein